VIFLVKREENGKRMGGKWEEKREKYRKFGLLQAPNGTEDSEGRLLCFEGKKQLGKCF